MNIPTEAVEAAYDKSLHIAINTAEIEAILEAAAPHMLAAAWDEGFRLGQTTWPTAAKSTPNPYRSRT